MTDALRILTIAREAECRLEIRRSRFVARSFKRTTPEAALEAVKEVREAHRDANHNVWAFRVGTTGEQARYSDDGEPKGTAGPPLLEVLKRTAAANVLLVVTRYFGGIKLGAGGLVRAYGEAGKSVLEASGLKELRRMATLEADVPYNLLAGLEHLAARDGVEILERRFGEWVTVALRLPADSVGEWRTFHANLVGGKFGSRVTAEGYD
jgi:uncharacterized YigZ family protein